MNKLREVVPAVLPLQGEKVTMDSILNLKLVFTDWRIRKSSIQKDSDYMILQFERDGRQFVVMTGSKTLMNDVRRYEEMKGKEPFEATVEKHGKAYVFA